MPLPAILTLTATPFSSSQKLQLCVRIQQNRFSFPLYSYAQYPSNSLPSIGIKLKDIMVMLENSTTVICNKFEVVIKREKLQKMEEQVETLGRAFVNHYYNLFDNDRSLLPTLYQPSSMLSFEGQKIVGVDDISCKLNSLPFEQCKHLISTIDAQPSSFAGGILVFVSGSLQLLGEDHPMRFSQMFHLIPGLQGGLFVQNDIFRLNYG